MKRYFLILFVLSAGSRLLGQCCPYMGEINTIPAYPTGTDTVFIVTRVGTPNEGALLYHELNVNDHTISITACYYEGMATMPTLILDTLEAGVLAPGNYTIQFTAYNSIYANQCTVSDTQYVEMPFSVGAASLPEKSGVEEILYPNPATEIVWLPETVVGEHVKAFSSDGRLVSLTMCAEDGKLRIDVSQLQPGMYYLYAGYRRFRFVKA